MSLLPNIREFNDANLAESPSDSKELMALKYKEQLQWQREAREHQECKEHK